MVSYVNSLSFHGIEIVAVNIQAHITSGMPSFNIVGLPDKTIGESKDRIRAALNSIGVNIPSKRITINLSPADLIKEGSHFDLPIAIALLIEMGVIEQEYVDDYFIAGELSLDASIMPIAGALPAAIGANSHNKGLICPFNNGGEAMWSGNEDILAPPDLLALVNHFKGTQLLAKPIMKDPIRESGYNMLDMQQVRGQDTAKRAFEIAAAGGHNILMIGPPGSGKSMLAARLPTILPDMTPEEMLECSMIASVAGIITDGTLKQTRPYRAPHHSCSMAAMVGGGAARRLVPGEISLAHNGALFLDEFPEFQRPVIEALRQPIEERKILISRSSAHITYPAKFQLIAAMNPCRCGHLDDMERNCNKAPKCAIDYQSRISGPILDRIDINIEITNLMPQQINSIKSGETSKQIGKKVEKARDIQQKRYNGYGILTNAELFGDLLNDITEPSNEGKKLLDNALEKMKLSMRGYYRVLKVARTIADLDNSNKIEKHHIAESLSYRQLLIKNPNNNRN